MSTVQAAFVMEQTLGHVTHYANLRAVVAEQEAVTATWLPIPFETHGPARLVPLLATNWSVRASWRARQALDASARRGRLDAAFFHTQVTSLFSLTLMRHVPSVVSLDATPSNFDSVGRHYGHRPAGHGPLDRWKHGLNRRAFRAAAALVAWSEWARASLVSDYGVDAGRVRVLAPGASARFFEIGRRRIGRDRRERGRPRLLFVGADFARKGGALLVKCARDRLRDRCELDLVTSADLLAGPNLRVHRGLAPNSTALFELFESADVFVLPSRADCLPVALMEAAAAGLPIVTTSIGALSEAVLPGESGFLVPPDEPAELAVALEALVEDASLRRRMGRAGHLLAIERFDARRNDGALLDLVRSVAASGQDRRAA